MENYLLTLLIFIPLIGSVIILFLPGNKESWIRYVAVGVTAIPLVLAYILYKKFNPAMTGIDDIAAFQFVEKYSWIPSFNIFYHVGVDGLSVTMVILTALVSFVGVFASFSIKKAVKAYFAMYLLLVTAMMGVFLALDFFLFYVFWEVMLLPMYFLIGIWGGPRKEYAAIKFFLYTLFGSVFMLLVMLLFYFSTGSFSLVDISATMISGNYPSYLALDWLRIAAWIALFVGFAIKIPAFPFHTWLPDAHVEAPTAISVILAGVLLKMGTYGLLRISYPLFPAETKMLAPTFLAFIGVINIIYGALVAMAQTDLKKLIAYSSISHMGYVMLGMASFTVEGINGAIFQMFNHGTITSMLFILVGVVYERAHHREINGFGGMASIAPKYAAFTAFAFFAGLGLPGLSGFISEILVLMGSFKTYKLLTIIAATGVILTAAYLLWAYLRIFFGQRNEKYADMPDITFTESFSLVPVGVFVILFGVYPAPYLKMVEPTMAHLTEIINGSLKLSYNVGVFDAIKSILL